MTASDPTTQLERQLSSLFQAEAAVANLPGGMWQTIAPRMGEPDTPFALKRFLDSIRLPLWRDPMKIRYVAPALTVLFAALIVLLFVLLINDDADDGNDTPVPATSPTVPASITVPGVCGGPITRLAGEPVFAIDDDMDGYVWVLPDGTDAGLTADQLRAADPESDSSTVIRMPRWGAPAISPDRTTSAIPVERRYSGEPQGHYVVVISTATEPVAGVVEYPQEWNQPLITTFWLAESGCLSVLVFNPEHEDLLQLIDIDGNVVREQEIQMGRGVVLDGAGADWVLIDRISFGELSQVEFVNIEDPGLSLVVGEDEVVPDLPGLRGAGELTAGQLVAELRDRPTPALGTITPTSTTPTATISNVIATPGITPPPSTPEAVQILRLDADAFGESVAGSVFEDLLARLPDNETTRSYTRLYDYGGMLDLLGLDRFPLGATDEKILEHALEIFQTDAGGLQIGLPEWPGYLTVSSDKPNWYPLVGFDYVNVEQSAFANSRYVPDDGEPIPLQTYDVAFGLFDADRTANSLASCACDQPMVRMHGGTDYYAWGEELIGDLRRRWAPPLYDDIGRGPRLFVGDGEAYWTLQNSAMENLIDVRTGATASLAESAGHIDAVRKMLSLGQMRDITIRSDHLSMDEQSNNRMNDFPTYPDVVQAVPLLEEFALAAEGVGFDGEHVFTGLVIAHDDAATAERNADLLTERILGIRRQVQDQELWAEIIERVEIAVDGTHVLVRLYYIAPEIHSVGFLILQQETLVVHE